MLMIRAFAAVAVLFVVGKAGAQVQGRVLAETGSPLAEVRVELWDGLELRAAKTTASDGAFRLIDSGSRGASGRHLAFRRIGFRPYTITIAPDSVRVEVTLKALPTTLTSQLVTAATTSLDPCVRKPSADAAAIFAAAAAHYRRDTPLFDQFARVSIMDVLVPAYQREVVPQLPLEGGSHYRRSAEPKAPLLKGPFPVPMPTNNLMQKSSDWSYPQFEYTDAPAFVMPAFVDSMPRSVVSSGPEGTVLSFCPRVRKGVFTSGEIALDRDTTIIAIRWRFVVPGSRDEKGGFAMFEAPPSQGLPAHLLPTNAVRWTRVRGTNNYHATRYSSGPWILTEPSARP